MTPRLTILFDNYPGIEGLSALWGFSALIRMAGQTILFDSGSNGRVLLKNMAALGIAPADIDLLFLSHPHWDHMGGLDSVLELNPRLTVVLQEGFSRHLIDDLSGLCGRRIVVGAEPRAIAPGIFSTGMLDSQPPEQALMIDAPDVTAAISGCAHPGMAALIERATSLLGRPVDWAIGGFHLMYADAPGIEQAIRSMQELGVGCVVPTHCTGDAARIAFRRAFEARCLQGGVGQEIRLTECRRGSGRRRSGGRTAVAPP
jgi:7,8-dihydropterin-6-yl-methyl-4-(beta-D-ribofuranosyl)aminobenzene 5'-phosphate synthase